MLKKTSFLLPMGIVALLVGAGLGYVYFIYLIHSGTVGVMMLLASVASVGIGFFFINRALASIEGFEKLTPPEAINGAETDANGHPLEHILDKNKNMVEDWAKTNKTRDELKLLEVSAAAQSQKE